MSNQWSDNLRKRMENHQEPSSDELWMDIVQALKQESSQTAAPKQNRILLWSKRLGVVAAILLLIVFIGNYLITENSQELQIVTQDTQAPYKQQNDSFTSGGKGDRPMMANSSDGVLCHPKKAVTISVSKESLHRGDVGNLIAKAEERVEAERNDSKEGVETKRKETDSRSNSEKEDRGSNTEFGIEPPLPIIRKKNVTAKWEASLYTSNISSNLAKSNEGYDSFVVGDVPLEGNEDQGIEGEDPYNDILVQNKYREIYTDIKHRQPIAIGLSANYNIDDKWSLTSGLTYIILSSELRSGSDSHYYTSKQTLHNIGIPLNINYKVWKSKKVSIYLSAGGLVEKNVSAKLTTDYIVDNQEKTKKDDKISVEQLQWSLNSSLGVQYNISSKVGLYVEPGVSYYIKNGSEIETIYKEKPLNLSLRLGLRFSLNE